MRPLTLRSCPIYEWFIHHVFVLQERKVGGTRSIAQLENGILLALLVSDLFNVTLVSVVNLLCLSILSIVSCLV